MNKAIKGASCKTRLDRHPGESRGPKIPKKTWIPSFDGMTNGSFCKRLKVITLVGLSLISIVGVLNSGPDSAAFSAYIVPMRAAVDSPKSLCTTESHQTRTLFEQAADVFDRAIHGIQVCAGDSEGENGDDKKADDKTDDSGNGIDRLWDVALYG